MLQNRVVQSKTADKMFYFFEEISRIPRGSDNEGEIASYIESFAKKRGLFCVRDEANNLLLRMEGSKGRENEASVLLQGHIDMVCEKDSGVEHDFLKDPIDLYVDDNGYLRAKGTTLGADDGIAVSIMLAVLDGELSSHPPIECLFTSGEEIGMVGAGKFDFSLVQSRTMINIDSETEGVAVVGCAGGVRSEMLLPLTRVAAVGEGIRVKLSGLCGGHSGEDINKGRANANRLMGRLLTELSLRCDISVSSIDGGSKDNAIPRECTALLAVKNISETLLAIEDITAVMVSELSKEDSGFVCSVDNAEVENVLSLESADKLIFAMTHLRCGVLEMSKDIDGLVEWSANLGIVTTNDDMAKLVLLTRSSIDKRIDHSMHLVDLFAKQLGAEAGHFGRYTGWSYAKESPLREKYLSVYKRLFCAEAGAQIIHAGLECGLVRSKIPDMDMIAIGPEIIALHSPAEKLNIASAERLWTLVAELLK